MHRLNHLEKVSSAREHLEKEKKKLANEKTSIYCVHLTRDDTLIASKERKVEELRKCFSEHECQHGVWSHTNTVESDHVRTSPRIGRSASGTSTMARPISTYSLFTL